MGRWTGHETKADMDNFNDKFLQAKQELIDEGIVETELTVPMIAARMDRPKEGEPETALPKVESIHVVGNAFDSDTPTVIVLRENGEKASDVIVPRSQRKRDVVAFADSQSGKLYNIPVRCCTRTKAGNVAYIVLTDDDLHLDNSLLGRVGTNFS